MINTIFKTILLGTGLLTVSVATAQDQEPQKDKVPKFDKMDTNNDQKLSLDEYNTYRAAVRVKQEKEPKADGFEKRFKEIDLNIDGFLSREEYTNREKKNSKKKKGKK